LCHSLQGLSGDQQIPFSIDKMDNDLQTGNLKPNNMNTAIRKAVEEDFAAILSLVRELATFQKSLEKVINTIEQMKEEKHLFQCYVAENEQKEIVGMASYFFAYYTWVGKSLYLDDLYVKESCRGQKTGSLLLRQIFEIAKNENCKRVRWQVSNWNKSAIEFYEKCGAALYDEYCICDFDEKGIREFKI
jgi:GNAT superfamily N-acetyltransferase